MAVDRGHFATRTGFILAAAGSAVGLGNIWKFPYVTGANGGAAFLVVYLVMVFTIGLGVMLAELAVGRAAERNPVGAYARLGGGAWPALGFLGVAAGFIILSFYNVVAGWTVAYVIRIFGGLLRAETVSAYGRAFENFIADPLEPVVFSALFMALTVGVVIRGVSSGIEKASKVLMPLLFVLVLALLVRAVTLPGATEGLVFFLDPEFGKLTTGTVLDALGMAFFSLSLGMGAMMTYGSYLGRGADLVGAALWVTVLDSMVAVLAGLIVLPAVFAFGFDPSAGPGLTFVTLPAVFAQMPLGAVFGVCFFTLLAVAALTSAVSLLEVVVAYFVDERGMVRRRAAITFGSVIFLIGIPSSLSFGVWSGVTVGGKSIFDALDFVASNVLLPIGGIGVAVFAGWVAYPRLLAEIRDVDGAGFAWAPLWRAIVMVVAPLAIAWILWAGLGL